MIYFYGNKLPIILQQDSRWLQLPGADVLADVSLLHQLKQILSVL